MANKPFIHVPLDEDELALLVGYLGKDVETVLQKELLERLQEAFAELLRESNTGN